MIKISTYGNTDAAVTGYPYGKFRDKTTSLAGTTNHADIFLDLYHALAAVIDHSVGAGNMTGTAETTTSSEFLTALLDIISTSSSLGAPGSPCLLQYEPTTAQQLVMRALPNQGQSLLDTEYPEIITAWGGKIFGNADSTHFYLPDDSGLHYRIGDNGAGVDTGAVYRADRGDGVSGDAIGTIQFDQSPAHKHVLTMTAAGGWDDRICRSALQTGELSQGNCSTNYLCGLSGTGTEVWVKNRYIWAGTYY